MFIIKLPPNMYYYSNPKETMMAAGAAGKSSHLSKTASKSTGPASLTPTDIAATANANNGKEVSKTTTDSINQTQTQH